MWLSFCIYCVFCLWHSNSLILILVPGTNLLKCRDCLQSFSTILRERPWLYTKRWNKFKIYDYIFGYSSTELTFLLICVWNLRDMTVNHINILNLMSYWFIVTPNQLIRGQWGDCQEVGNSYQHFRPLKHLRPSACTFWNVHNRTSPNVFALNVTFRDFLHDLGLYTFKTNFNNQWYKICITKGLHLNKFSQMLNKIIVVTSNFRITRHKIPPRVSRSVVGVPESVSENCIWLIHNVTVFEDVEEVTVLHTEGWLLIWSFSLSNITRGHDSHISDIRRPCRLAV